MFGFFRSLALKKREIWRFEEFVRMPESETNRIEMGKYSNAYHGKIKVVGIGPFMPALN